MNKLIHQLLCCAALILSAGCPAHPQFLVAEVTTPARAPIADALVAAECAGARAAAQTDERGQARVPLRGDVTAEACMVVVARDGYETIERRGASTCSNVNGCPRTRYQLETLEGAER